MVDGTYPDSLVGTYLREKWHLDALLGVGGAGAVYSATHRNGRRAAIKIVLGHERTSRNVRQRLLRECRAANRVSHPGAITILDDDVTDTGELFIVMELLEGQTLEQLTSSSREPLDLPLVARIGSALLDILSAAHRAGVVHRDIKPSNVFLTHDGQLKLLDFGVACLDDVDEDEKLTVSGGIVGTPAFMAPEQARGRSREVDARTDVWAVGALLFTLLTQRPVHEGETRNEVLVSAATTAVPPIRNLRDDLPAPFASVIDRALSFSPGARYSDAAEMLSALSDWAPEAGLQRPFGQQAQGFATTVLGGATDNAVQVLRTGRRTPSRPRWYLMTGIALSGVCIVLLVTVGASHLASGPRDSGNQNITPLPELTPAGRRPPPKESARPDNPRDPAPDYSAAPDSPLPAPSIASSVRQAPKPPKTVVRAGAEAKSRRQPGQAEPRLGASSPSQGQAVPVQPPSIDPLDIR